MLLFFCCTSCGRLNRKPWGCYQSEITICSSGWLQHHLLRCCLWCWRNRRLCHFFPQCHFSVSFVLCLNSALDETQLGSWLDLTNNSSAAGLTKHRQTYKRHASRQTHTRTHTYTHIKCHLDHYSKWQHDGNSTICGKFKSTVPLHSLSLTPIQTCALSLTLTHTHTGQIRVD